MYYRNSIIVEMGAVCRRWLSDFMRAGLVSLKDIPGVDFLCNIL